MGMVSEFKEFALRGSVVDLRSASLSAVRSARSWIPS